MADWTAADVVLIAPEFESTPLAQVQRYCDLAALEVSAENWGAKAKHAGVLLTAHLLTIYGAKPGASVDGAAGAISSKAVGDVSVSYSAASSAMASHISGASLTLSRYGQEYFRLQRLRSLGASVL